MLSNGWINGDGRSTRIVFFNSINLLGYFFSLPVLTREFQVFRVFFFIIIILEIDYNFFVGSTPRVILGSQTTQSPPNNSEPGYVWWSIQFDRAVRTITIYFRREKNNLAQSSLTLHIRRASTSSLLHKEWMSTKQPIFLLSFFFFAQPPFVLSDLVFLIMLSRTE